MTIIWEVTVHERKDMDKPHLVFERKRVTASDYKDAVKKATKGLSFQGLIVTSVILVASAS